MEGRIQRQRKKGPHSLQILNPTAVLRYTPMPPAKRLPDLKNKKIGLYWNHKARGNIALERVKELLTERYAGVPLNGLKPPFRWRRVRSGSRMLRKGGSMESSPRPATEGPARRGWSVTTWDWKNWGFLAYPSFRRDLSPMPSPLPARTVSRIQP